MIRFILALALSTTAVTGLSSAETLAVKGNIWTGTDAGQIENGVVIIEDGEIIRVGGPDTRIPDDATVMDSSGLWVTPGIFAPFSRLGIVEVGAESTTNDTGGASELFAASLRASDGFNPSATSIDISRVEGITHAAIAPQAGHLIVGGLGFVADTSGTPGSIVDDATFLFVEIGETGAQRAGGSRSAGWAYLRGILAEGEKSRIGSYRVGPTNITSETDAETLANVIRGRIKLMLRANRASDLRQIIDLKGDYRNLDVVIVGAREGWLVAAELADADIPVIVDPFDNLPSSFESLGATSRNAERLISAGVQTAFAHLADDGHQARLTLQVAGNAVANGVSHSDALAAITSVPADIFELGDEGRIERGANGTIVIWDGDPLEISSSPQTIVINGNMQTLQSRQTRLRDRYLSLEPSDHPYSYKTSR